jgi:hypothetical protein
VTTVSFSQKALAGLTILFLDESWNKNPKLQTPHGNSRCKSLKKTANARVTMQQALLSA